MRSASSLANEKGFVNSMLSMYFLPVDVTVGTDFVEGFNNRRTYIGSAHG